MLKILTTSWTVWVFPEKVLVNLDKMGRLCSERQTGRWVKCIFSLLSLVELIFFSQCWIDKSTFFLIIIYTSYGPSNSSGWRQEVGRGTWRDINVPPPFSHALWSRPVSSNGVGYTEGGSFLFRSLLICRFAPVVSDTQLHVGVKIQTVSATNVNTDPFTKSPAEVIVVTLKL